MTRSCLWILLLVSAGILPAMTGCEKAADPSHPDKAESAASSTPKDSASGAAAVQPGNAGSLTTAHAVLDKMAEAYRNAASYEDFATADFWEEGAKEGRRADFQVIFQRPNKLRMKLYEGELTCDGKKWFGYSKEIPDQAVLRDAPPAIKMPMLTADMAMNRALNGGFAGGSPQALLLLEEHPLDVLLEGVRDQDLALGEPVRLGDYECYRVTFRRTEGVGEYWIDQKTYVLRHMEFRAADPAAGQAPDATPAVRIEANFERARLGGAVDPTSFKIEVPGNVECHRALMDASAYRVVGQKLAGFQLADAQGKPWNSDSLAGKVAVLHLWQTDVPACPAVVPNLQLAYEKFKDNPRVAFWAINLDGKQVDTAAVEQTARQWKLTLPLLRDVNLESPKALKTAAPPATFFVDAQGVLQDCILGDSPLSTAATSRKVEELLTGKQLAQQALKEFHEQFQSYETSVDKVFSGEVVTSTFQQLEATAAPARSEPKKLRLTPLWKRSLNGIAANLLVAPINGKPRILVVDGFKAITEIGLDGTPGESHHTNLSEKELFTTLRTAVGGDGKRYFAAFGPWQQRVHFFDENLKPLLSYPEDALENPHPGITDVELADLAGDGQVNAYIGFGGIVGVKCVSMQGKPLASCRNLFNIGRIAAGPPDETKRRQLYCVTDAVNVAVLDAKLQLRDSSKLTEDAILEGLMQADLAGDGRVTWCEVIRRPDSSQPAAGQYTAIGLNTHGEAIWKYNLPFGAMRTVEPIIAGRVLPGAAAQWLLPGCDGSVHVLAADGTLIDRFNYGQQINGLAVTEIDGKPVLLISSASGVEALRVEP